MKCSRCGAKATRRVTETRTGGGSRTYLTCDPCEPINTSSTVAVISSTPL
ncbi:hypothetical protein [Micromonospora okii]|nr:hypothetical protein [Micromonospora okii]